MKKVKMTCPIHNENLHKDRASGIWICKTCHNFTLEKRRAFLQADEDIRKMLDGEM